LLEPHLKARPTSRHDQAGARTRSRERLAPPPSPPPPGATKGRDQTHTCVHAPKRLPGERPSKCPGRGSAVTPVALVRALSACEAGVKTAPLSSSTCCWHVSQRKSAPAGLVSLHKGLRAASAHRAWLTGWDAEGSSGRAPVSSLSVSACTLSCKVSSFEFACRRLHKMLGALSRRADWPGARSRAPTTQRGQASATWLSFSTLPASPPNACHAGGPSL